MYLLYNKTNVHCHRVVIIRHVYWPLAAECGSQHDDGLNKTHNKSIVLKA